MWILRITYHDPSPSQGTSNPNYSQLFSKDPFVGIRSMVKIIYLKLVKIHFPSEMNHPQNSIIVGLLLDSCDGSPGWTMKGSNPPGGAIENFTKQGRVCKSCSPMFSWNLCYESPKTDQRVKQSGYVRLL